MLCTNSWLALPPLQPRSRTQSSRARSSRPRCGLLSAGAHTQLSTCSQWLASVDAALSLGLVFQEASMQRTACCSPAHHCSSQNHGFLDLRRTEFPDANVSEGLKAVFKDQGQSLTPRTRSTSLEAWFIRSGFFQSYKVRPCEFNMQQFHRCFAVLALLLTIMH